jgi:hypothetical protein
MPWVTFERPFIFVPPEDRRVAVKYPAGWRGNVRKVCAEQAAEAGAVDKPEVSDGDDGDTSGPADLPAASD